MLANLTYIMKRSIFIIFLIVCSFLTVHAQEMTVKSMQVQPMDLSARVNGRMDHNNEPCALIKVELAVPDAVFEGNIVGTVERHVNEYWVYMTAGSKTLYVKHPLMLSVKVTFSDYNIFTLEGRQTYHLILSASLPVFAQTSVAASIAPADSSTIEFGHPSPVSGTQPLQSSAGNNKSLCFYVEGQYQLGAMMGAGFAFGSFINRVNVEASMLIGMSETEELFLHSSSTIQKPFSYTYKALGYNLKFGYAIPFNKSIRLTPQVGIGICSVSGTESQKGTGKDPDATKAYSVPLTLGARLDYSITQHFGISLTPDIALAVTESDLYTRLSEGSSDVKSFGQGFNMRVGLFVSF